MTIATTVTKVGYTGDGVTVAFAVPFPFFDTDELEVIERVIATGAETVKTLTTHYTVAGGNGSTGTVTALVAPAASVQWHILRKTALVQETDYPENDPFPAASHEQGLDRGIMIDQEQKEVADRTLKFPKTDPSNLDATLPSSVDRKGKYLTFDSVTGAPSMGAPPTVDSASLTVIQGTDPGHVEGRIWIDTSAAPIWRFKLSKGGSWITINEINTTNTPWFAGAVLGAVAAAGVGDGLEIVAGLLRPKLADDTLVRDANGLSASGAPYPPKYIQDFEYIITTTSTTVKVGWCRDKTHSKNMTLPAQITKLHNAIWAVGNNQGGIDGASSLLADTTYHIHHLTGAAVPADIKISTSFANPGLPAGYSWSRRIGSFLTDGAGVARPGTYSAVNETFQYETPVLSVAVTNLSNVGSTSFPLATPFGMACTQLLNIFSNSAGPNQIKIFPSLNVTPIAPSSTVAPLMDLSHSTSPGDGKPMELPNFGSLIYVTTVTNNATFRCTVRGWKDPRTQ